MRARLFGWAFLIAWVVATEIAEWRRRRRFRLNARCATILARRVAVETNT